MLRYDIRTGVKKIKTKTALTISGTGIGIAGLLMAMVMPIAAHAVSGSYHLFGDASIVTGGNPGNAAQIRSDASIAPGYGGVEFSPTTAISWSALTTLSTDYNVTDDNCGGGSPRIVLGVDTNSDGTADGYVSIAIGPSPNFTGCTQNSWQSTGNLIGNTDAGRYDYSQFGGSTFTTYANAPSSVRNGKVVSSWIVVDSSWSPAATGGDGEQTVLIDNIDMDGSMVTFEPAPSKDSCKNNGWMAMNDGTKKFKNQGDCVSYFATNGKNVANGQ